MIPQLFTGKLSREEIEETLARLLESTKHLIPTPDEELPVKIKEEPISEDDSDNEMEGVEPTNAATTTAEGAEPTHGLKTQPGIKTDDIPSSTDLKKMTSKERRQLRNKISARNFRVRRKGKWRVIDIGVKKWRRLLSALWIYPSIYLKRKGEKGKRGRGEEEGSQEEVFEPKGKPDYQNANQPTSSHDPSQGDVAKDGEAATPFIFSPLSIIPLPSSY